MRLQKPAVLVLLVVLSIPAFARDRESPGIADRIAKAVTRFLRIVTNGDGLIPPIPEPPKP
jgi:hypothetical protein